MFLSLHDIRRLNESAKFRDYHLTYVIPMSEALQLPSTFTFVIWIFIIPLPFARSEWEPCLSVCLSRPPLPCFFWFLGSSLLVDSRIVAGSQATMKKLLLSQQCYLAGVVLHLQHLRYFQQPLSLQHLWTGSAKTVVFSGSGCLRACPGFPIVGPCAFTLVSFPRLLRGGLCIPGRPCFTCIGS